MKELLYSLLSNREVITSAVVLVGGVLVAVYRITTSKENIEIKEGIRKSFEDTVKGLYSVNETERISSAILLRRYLNKRNREGRKSVLYKIEALNVISSLLKIEKCSEIQKTLGDSLSYTINIDKLDLQYTNLQNVCIKPDVRNLRKDIPWYKRFWEKEIDLPEPTSGESGAQSLSKKIPWHERFGRKKIRISMRDRFLHV